MITIQEVKEAFKRAPDSLKSYVESDDLFNTFHEIRKAHKLHIDQAGNLEMALHSVILGLKQFNELPGMMKEILSDINDSEQQAILKDFNDKVFVPLRQLTKERAEAVAHKVVPTIQRAETVLRAAAPVSVAPVTPPVTVVEQKMSTTVAPASKVQNIPAPPPIAPPKYHGIDPYKEPIE